jgi:hypothetical protein
MSLAQSIKAGRPRDSVPRTTSRSVCRECAAPGFGVTSNLFA